MKNYVKWLGIIAFLAIIGITFLACGKDSLDRTTWKANENGMEFVLKFNSPNFTLTLPHITHNGSYAISGITVDMATESGDNISGTLAGNTLSLIADGETVIFKKD